MYLRFKSLQHQVFTCSFFLLHTFSLLLLTVSSCPLFSFAAALCQQVMQCSHHCCVNVCDKRKNKWDDEKKQGARERDRRDGDKKLTVICTDGGTPAL